MTNQLKTYDNYEIHPCAELTNEGETESYVEQCPESEADFWCLFGHIPGEGVEAIGDFKSRKDAEQIYYRITGQPFGSPEQNAARVRVMHGAEGLLALLKECEEKIASYQGMVATDPHWDKRTPEFQREHKSNFLIDDYGLLQRIDDTAYQIETKATGRAAA